MLKCYFLLPSMVHAPLIFPFSFTFKTLSLSHSSRWQSNNSHRKDVLGEAEHVAELVVTLACIWSSPLRVALYLGLLWAELGPSVLVGVTLLLVLISVNSAVERKAKELRVSKGKCMHKIIKEFTASLYIHLFCVFNFVCFSSENSSDHQRKE